MGSVPPTFNNVVIPRREGSKKMNNYKASFFNGTGHEGALVVTAKSADAAEVLAEEAAEFYGFFFCPSLTVIVPVAGMDGITAHSLDYEEACRELESACGFDCMGDAEITIK